MGNIALPHPNNATDLYPGISPPYTYALKVTAAITSFASIVGGILVIIRSMPCARKKSNSKLRSITCHEVAQCCCSYETMDEENNQEGIDKEGNSYRPNFKDIFIIYISVCDIMVAFSHIWGIFQNLEGKFIDIYKPIHIITNSTNFHSGKDQQCTVQGAITVFFTIASFLWTLAMMISLVSIEIKPNYTNTVCLKKFNKNVKVDADKDPHYCDTIFFMIFFWPMISFGLPALLVFSLTAAYHLGYAEGISTGM